MFFILAALAARNVINTQAQSAQALIDSVNSFRASYGLQPYTIDSSLMANAQSQSDYQATIHQNTHERADGSQPPCTSENICAITSNINADYCVQSMWKDQLHLLTLIGFSTGTIGAGLAGAEGMNYYTLQVNNTGDLTHLDVASAQSSTQYVGENTNAGSAFVDIEAAPVQPGQFATSTPELDGSIYHIVQSNETLWSIAIDYGKTVAELQTLNGKTADDTSVIAGQRLLITYGGTPVADTLTPSVTPLPITNTPKMTSTPTMTAPPLPTLTPTVTMTSTPEPFIRHISFFDTPQARPFGLVLTIICALGLIATLYFGFHKS